MDRCLCVVASLILIVAVAACDSNGTESSVTTTSTTGAATTTSTSQVSTTETPTTTPPTSTTTTTTTTTTSTTTTTTTVPSDVTPPELVITAPQPGETVTTRTYRFTGTTDPGCTVTAAGRYSADVDADGNWSIILVLNEGGNLATFTATDPAGNTTTAKIGLTYQPPPPEPDYDWYEAALPGMTEVSGVSVGPSGYIAVGRDAKGVEFWTSPDGFVWERRHVSDAEFPVDYVVHELIWTGSEYVALGIPAEPPGPVAWRSTNLGEWEPIELPCGGPVHADQIEDEGGTTVIAGGCDATGGTWVSHADSAYAWHPTPFTGLYELVPVGGEWYGHGGGLWVSSDAEAWVPADSPVAVGDIAGIAAVGDTLYLVADGYGPAGELWSKVGDMPWVRASGTLSAGEDLYAGGTITAGPAGLLVAWRVGYPPGAHQTQSPVLIDRGDVQVYLYRHDMPDAAFITDETGNQLLSVSFPDPGSGPPDHVEIDYGAAVVRFLDPVDGGALAELTFDEVDSALHLELPRLHAWWSTESSSFIDLGAVPVEDLRWSAIGEGGVTLYQTVLRAEYPFWVTRIAGSHPYLVSEVWFLELPTP